ncbi:hypothetical protein MRX96_059634 [Rhipicephalus microplus]
MPDAIAVPQHSTAVVSTPNAYWTPRCAWPLHLAAVQPSYHRDQWPIMHAQPVGVPMLRPPVGRRAQQALNQVVCRRCSCVGHIARNCASRPRQDQVVCFQCGRPGHFQPCAVLGKRVTVGTSLATAYSDFGMQVASAAGEGKEALLDVRISSTTFRALFDTGSSVNLLGPLATSMACSSGEKQTRNSNTSPGMRLAPKLRVYQMEDREEWWLTGSKISLSARPMPRCGS